MSDERRKVYWRDAQRLSRARKESADLTRELTSLMERKILVDKLISLYTNEQ